MKRDTKEAIGFPLMMIVTLGCCYLLIKLISSIPPATSDEAVFGGALILAFLGVPLFFGTLIAIVVICAWMSTEDSK